MNCQDQFHLLLNSMVLMIDNCTHDLETDYNTIIVLNLIHQHLIIHKLLNSISHYENQLLFYTEKKIMQQQVSLPLYWTKAASLPFSPILKETSPISQQQAWITMRKAGPLKN